jgi:DNA-binding response OmpR family regulator
VNGAKKVLAIDNEQDIAMIIKIGLESEGFESDVYVDPLDALKQYSRSPDSYFLVLSDVRMPKMSGFQLARMVRSIRPEANVILMTAFEIDKSEFGMVFPSMKVDDFLQKPFSISTLHDLVLKYSNQSVRTV